MKTIKGLVCISLSLLLFSCSSSSDSSESEQTVTNLTSNLVALSFVLDYRNNGNAGDLIVRYSVNNSSNLSALWLYIAPESRFSSINSKVLSELQANRYQNISISTSLSDISPSAQLLDTDGNPVGPGVRYKLGFATVKDGSISKDAANFTFELKDQHYLTGRYTGTWNDEMFTNYAISIDIASFTSGLRGPVYANNVFEAQYGGQDDGEIAFQVNGDLLENIVWDDDLTDYMGGCTGRWTGEGTIDDLTTLRMNLAGQNCLYSSQNVVIELKRSF